MGKRIDLAVFDMDGVLTKVRSSWAYVHEVLEVDGTENYNAFINQEIDEIEFMRRDIGLWLKVRPNLTVTEIARMFRDMPLMDGIQETIAALSYNGIQSVIVSGGIDLAAKMIAEEYGFDGYHADTLCSNPDGTLTGEGQMNVDLKDKGATVKRVMEEFGVSPERTLSIGNSFTDITMFETTGESIAFNPADQWTEAAAKHVVKSQNISDVLDVVLFEIEDGV